MTSQLDFLAAPVPTATERVARQQVVTKDVVGTDDEAMARHLETTGNYRILRKLQLRPIVEQSDNRLHCMAINPCFFERP